MDSFDKLGDTVSAVGRNVAKKAKEIASVAGLNAKAAAQEGLIDKYYRQIGRLVYKRAAQGQWDAEDCDEELQEKIKLVDAAFEEIGRLQEEIRRIKEEMASAPEAKSPEATSP